ncbi:MAG: hypothetical protein KQJ78_20575 [Deltaproteobacteria bacterium]|nr:hypothetical protein [Deltaproteobacteria bacterium]
MYTEGVLTFTAGEAIEARRLVNIKSGTTTTPPEVEKCDAGDDAIGVTEYAAASGALVAVRPINFPGSQEVSAADSFSVGAVLYSGADGQISDSASGSALGIAKEAATAQGDLVEAVLWSVKSTTAATVSVADAGGLVTGTTAEAVIAELATHLQSAQKTIPVPLSAITQEDGTALTKQATTVAGLAQLANKEQVIQIPVDCSAGESLGFSAPVPQDLDESADITVHVLAGKDADNDVLTLDCEVYPVAAGDVANADIQGTAAQAVTQAASELVFTCDAAGVLAAPGALTVVLALGGTNDGDAVYIYGAWIEYQAKLLSA